MSLFDDHIFCSSNSPYGLPDDLHFGEFPDNPDPVLPTTECLVQHDPSSVNVAMDGSGRPGLSTRGLRQFSLRICNKVEDKGVTTYNEVADELVMELGGKGDQKNIRRRVYDVLNVLMAMDIIRKEKKEIVWQGISTHKGDGKEHNIQAYEDERNKLASRIMEKRKTLIELMTRHDGMKNLIQRNKIREERIGDESGSDAHSGGVFHMPFILISSHKDSRIRCEMLDDRSHYHFKFDSPFAIHGDLDILRMMGLVDGSRLESCYHC